MEIFRKASPRPAPAWATVSRMRRRALRLGALCLLLAGGAVAAVLSGASSAATTPTTTTLGTVAPVTSGTLTTKSALILTGHGWGHGLGLSQWGAYGYAKHGWTYDRILTHYYVGTSLGAAPVSTIRVLVAQKPATTLSATAAWTATDSAGTVVQLAAGAPLALKPDFAVEGQTLVPPVTFRSTAPLTVDGKAYRGKLVVSLAAKQLLVVNKLGLEAYVKGVVPMEMPSNWAPEAVKAQAVAARSYALANVAKGRAFDVYGDGRSQVYGGVAGESPAASAAVDATRGEVVLYAGKVADTMFFSSSGGRTASAQESMGVSIPYLISVVDPYDTISPYHNWGPVVYDLAKVGKALNLPSAIDDLRVTPGTSPRAQTVSALLDDETTATVRGNTVRTVLGLRSTWFTPQLLELVPPKKALAYGSAATLTGFARGVTDPITLESKPTGGVWAPVGPLTPGANGALSTSVSPQLTTQYRLAVGKLRVALAKVGVAPVLSVQQAPTGLAGSVQPLLPGAPVDLQVQSGSVWTTVGSTVIDSGGAWTFGGQLAPGTYRVRCTPGHGFVAAVSPALQVS
jgi:SpoIID/LytB domain protein